MLVHCAPKLVQHAVDPDVDLIHVPGVTRLRPPPPEPQGEAPAELQTPAPDALVGDDDAPLSQEQFDVRKLRLKLWYSQIAWLMIAPGKRWQRYKAGIWSIRTA